MISIVMVMFLAVPLIFVLATLRGAPEAKRAEVKALSRRRS
jgi:hypothetical protein